jgi:hypothetical protein
LLARFECPDAEPLKPTEIKGKDNVPVARCRKIYSKKTNDGKGQKFGTWKEKEKFSG